MSSILFYAPFNQHSRDTESLMIAFRTQGHHVIFLSQQEGHEINEFLLENGVSAYTHVLPGKRSGWWYYVRHLFFFIRFCWKHRIEIVYSHLEPANFVASIGQYLIRGKTYLCRHHINEGQLYRFDKKLYYRITYRLARMIIVVSNHARNYMIEKEHIPDRKIIHINLAYNFDLYDKPDEQKVREIKNEYKADILLLAACRLTVHKRPEATIELVQKLTNHGLNVKLILLGKGELFDKLQTLILAAGLQQKVFMPGYVDNVLEFMSAADFFVHPSLLDSSCVAIKEAGLVRLPVIACQGIGDFNDYIVHGRNGFLVNPDRFTEDSVEIIIQNFSNKNLLENMGMNLRNSVYERFSIENVIGQYHSLNQTR